MSAFVLEVLTFWIATRQFALPVSCVKALRPARIVSPPPADAPAIVAGVIETTKGSVAVLSGRARLGGCGPASAEQLVIVFECRGRPLGLLVDSVGEVTALTAASANRPPPEIGVCEELVAAIAIPMGEPVVVLDPDGMTAAAEAL